MNKKYLLLLLVTATIEGYGQTVDSLNHYLETAMRNNFGVKAAAHAGEAAMQKIPQAGAYEDPKLDVGFYPKPMSIVDGRQVANFQVMQMFPWFGVRKAARTEARHMANMSAEQLREARSNLYLEVHTQWYLLCSLQQKLNNNGENLSLLQQLETLALQKFASGSIQAASRPAEPVQSPPSPSVPSGGGDSMGGMGMPSSPAANAGNSPGTASMEGMGSSMNASSRGMSEVLRIQLEIAELESNRESILSEITAGKARFNALLSRPAGEDVVIPGEFSPLPFLFDTETVMQAVEIHNPMLGMLNEESLSYAAKAEMDKKMGYPMWGIGLQYMWIKAPLNSTLMGEDASPSGSMGGAGAMEGADMIMPMVSVTLPLYRTKYKAAYKESKFLQRAAEEKYLNTLHTLEAELYRLRHQLDDASRKISLYQKQAALARITYDLAVQEFASGQSSLGDVIQIRRQLLDYEWKVSDAVATYNTVIANIRKMISADN